MVKLKFSAGQPQLFKQPWSTHKTVFRSEPVPTEADLVAHLLAIVTELHEELARLKIRLAESSGNI